MATHPWDIYAEQMYTHGYGYPLWTPDPAPGASEVMIGDVGWLDEGAFHTLFNALKGLEEPQPRGDAPVDYLPLERDKAVIDGPRETTSQPALFGRSIRDVTAGASVSTGGTISTPSVGLSIHFECRDDYGAVLLLHPLGVSHAIKSHNLISRYMRQHFERWLEFANSRFELGLKDEELIFVCGTIKTSRWGVAAFHGDYREKSGSITGNMSSLASVDFSLRVADAQLQSAYYRAGPPRYRLGPAMPMAISEGEVAGAGTAGDQDKADQCIFVHYYKMKRRMFVLQFPIRAAASPRDLSEDHEDDVPGSTSWCDAIVVDESGDLGEGEHRQAFDPVTPLLDYILQHSESQYALASSLDIKRLFGDSDMWPPEDVYSELVRLRPSIDVDEHGVGIVAHRGVASESASLVPSAPSSSLGTQSGVSNVASPVKKSNQGVGFAPLSSKNSGALIAPDPTRTRSRSLTELPTYLANAGCPPGGFRWYAVDEALRQRFKPKNVRGRTWNGEAVFPVSYPEDSEPSSSTSRAGIPQSTDEPPNNSMYMLHHYLQKRGKASSLSWEDKVIGPRHAPEYTSAVKIDGETIATAFAPQKSSSRDMAAKAALVVLFEREMVSESLVPESDDVVVGK